MSRFSSYNTHRLSPDQYWQMDHHLRLLQAQPYLYENPIIAELSTTVPGIYTVGGGRQIGKTTLLKQWVARLLAQKVNANAIMFFTGELIDDQHMLVNYLQNFIESHAQYPLLYIIVDEITYIKNWDKGIKFLADAGLFSHCIVILTGSDLMLMQAARMTFPGRRGRAEKVDFHIYALSFYEYLQLKKSINHLDKYMHTNEIPAPHVMQTLYQEFSFYLKHGGYLTAINDMARDGKIARATLMTYSDWIRGDILKRDKQEAYLREIIQAIIARYSSQITWHSLASELSIDSHNTVSDYCALLASMDALFIQPAILLDKLVAAPKKARKLSFTDPFIYHALKYWVSDAQGEPMVNINHDSEDPEISAALVEAVVSNHCHRFYPTYYLKAACEIDVVYVYQKRAWPIEVKWRNQLRPKDVVQLEHYPKTRVFSKTTQINRIGSLSIQPLPWALLQFQ